MAYGWAAAHSVIVYVQQQRLLNMLSRIWGWICEHQLHCLQASLNIKDYLINTHRKFVAYVYHRNESSHLLQEKQQS